VTKGIRLALVTGSTMSMVHGQTPVHTCHSYHCYQAAFFVTHSKARKVTANRVEVPGQLPLYAWVQFKLGTGLVTWLGFLFNEINFSSQHRGFTNVHCLPVYCSPVFSVICDLVGISMNTDARYSLCCSVAILTVRTTDLPDVSFCSCSGRVFG